MREEVCIFNELAGSQVSKRNKRLASVWLTRFGVRKDWYSTVTDSEEKVAQVAQIFGGVKHPGSVGTESVSAEFSTTASEPWLGLHVTVEE